MSLSLQSCCLETLIGLAHSHGFGCSLLVSLGYKSNLPQVRGLRIIRTSYQLDARQESVRGDCSPGNCVLVHIPLSKPRALNSQPSPTSISSFFPPWRRIARVGRCDAVYCTGKCVRPAPYPRSRNEWGGLATRSGICWIGLKRRRSTSFGGDLVT
jgi:hypothetical protein